MKNDSNEDSFKSHVNSEKNDFAKWILDVFNDYSLYEKLNVLTTRPEMLDVLAKDEPSEELNDVRINLLQRIEGLFIVIERNRERCLDSSMLDVLISKLNEVKKNIIGSVYDNSNDISVHYLEQSKHISQIINELNKIGVFDKPKKDVVKSDDAGSQLDELKNDLISWKIGDLADHQELKAAFLLLEKDLDYKIGDLTRIVSSYKHLENYNDKLSRHTTLITYMDKELHSLKRQINSNTEHLKKVFDILKDISLKLK